MPFPLPFAGLERRAAWLRAILLSSCLLGMMACVPLWLNARLFPLLPVARGFPVLPPPWDKCFFAALLLALLLAFWFYRTAVVFFLVASLYAYGEDQNRGQPWFYLYWVLFWLTLLPEPSGRAACRLAISAVYVWGGIQKCNPVFFQIIPDWFASPAATWHLPGFIHAAFRWSVAGAPFIEIFIGLALWVPGLTRRMALAAVLAVHLTSLLFLGPLGHDYNWIVWPWNLAMIALAFALFPPSSPDRFLPDCADLFRSKPALALVALFWLLPILGFFGLWDSYFSFCLYSEREAKADIFVTEGFSDRLPPPMQKHVHRVQVAYNPQIQGPYVFDYVNWGIQELGVPPIMEPRSYRSIYRYVRTYATNVNDLRMLVTPRSGPTMFYQGNQSWTVVQSQ